MILSLNPQCLCLLREMTTVHTVHKDLLLVGQDARQVCSLQTAFPFSCVPCAPVGKVFVALSLELVPAIITGLRVCDK